MRISLFGLIYLAIGLVVALTNGYNSIAGLSEVLSLLIASPVAGGAARRRPAPAADRDLRPGAAATRMTCATPLPAPRTRRQRTLLGSQRPVQFGGRFSR